MQKVSRFGVSFERSLLSEFDEAVHAMGYPSRSEAIMDLARKFLLERRIKVDPGVHVTGTLTMVYDHHTGDLTQRLLEMQHEWNELIISTTHIHVDHDTCLEVLVLKGPVSDVERLSDGILALKGVRQGKLVLTRVETPHRH